MPPLFPGRITISSVSDTGFGFTILSAILFPIHSNVDSTALRSSFLKALFRSSSPVFLVACINYFPYLFDGFLANYKNPYPLT